ncbi:MAG TPA: ATP-binding protein [Candidatus Limnocylindria bacterium]|nr:ATP-binding protein [Candidatus Limnocylindria bacterium]
MTRLAGQIALVTLGVAALVLSAMTIAVLMVSSASFSALMVEHGSSVELARQMFDESVRNVVIVAALVAIVAAAGVAPFLSRRISAPVVRVAAASRRLAEGDLHVRVPRGGPEEIASLADSFNILAERLEEQERLRGEFVVNAAHELRTPLTNLQGYLEALRDGVVPGTRETFESLGEEVERLLRLSRSLDALAEGELDREPPPRSAVDVGGAVGRAVELTLPALERRGITLEVRIPAGLNVNVNADHFTQVLVNLMQNAARYTPQAGRVEVSAQRRANDVLVSVTNTGERIPAQDLPHLFERFYRVEKSRDRSRGGAGIGLAIVKQLVERAGGAVGVDSNDELTRVWVSLPA